MNTVYDDKCIKHAFYNKFWFVLLAYFIALLLVVAAIISYSFYRDWDEAVEHIKNDSLNNVKSLDSKIFMMFDSVKADLIFLSKLNATIRYKSILDQADRRQIADEFQSFAATKGMYDQVRYIDSSGNEIVRVNYSNGKAEIVPDDGLQNKADRYYFKETMAVRRDNIYLSPLDLNIEHHEIEVPYKPMIRFGVPVYLDNGEVRGCVVLNYLAANILSRIRIANTRDEGVFYLINREGYFLSHIDAKKEWGFMLSARERYNIKNEYPEIWQRLKEAAFVQEVIGDLIVSYTVIKPLQYVIDNTAAPQWTLINIVDLAEWSLSKQQLYYKIIRYVVLCAFGVLVVSVILARIMVQRNRLEDELKHRLYYDVLTELPNRRLLFDCVSQVIRDSKQDKFNYAVLCIDLNGFKAINDTKGYKAGDQVLKIAAQRMKSMVRECDTVARIGSDEFAVIISRFESAVYCTKVADKLLESLGREYVLMEGVVNIGASIGVAVADSEKYEAADAIFTEAEDLMREVKNSGKNNAVKVDL